MQGDDDRFEIVGGAPAAALAEADPFWRALRRRHPDVGLVLLPPAGTAPVEVTDEVVEVPVAEAQDVLDALATALWDDLVGRDGAETEARWTSGAVPVTARREVTLRLDGVDDVDGVGLVVRAERRLQEAGWHTLAPPDGMPRVMAGRDAVRAGAVGRDELTLVHAPRERRLVLRVRPAAVRLGREAARSTVAGGDR